nr:retrotransposon-related protein [Tanacetum cinerariifolium]
MGRLSSRCVREAGAATSRGFSALVWHIAYRVTGNSRSFAELAGRWRRPGTDVTTLDAFGYSEVFRGRSREWMSWNGLITTWDGFEESVKSRFGPSKYEDPQGALSKLLQLGTVEDYQREFEKLINRVTDIPNSLLIFYISGLKLNLQHELLVSRPTTLGDAFFLARIIEARFEAIAKKEKERIIKKKTDILVVMRLVVAVDGVFDMGESNVESMEVRSKFGEFSENKKSVKEVVGDGEALGFARMMTRRLQIMGFLEGVATKWFQWMSWNGLITTWDGFEESVKSRFGPSKYEDPQGALSKLLQLGTVEDYQREFEKLINRVTDIPNSLLIFYISGLKLNLQHELLVSRPTTLGDAFFLARIIEARFEAIAKKEKERIIKKKTDILVVMRLVVAVDGVFDMGESNVESMEVRSKFGEFSENKKSVKEVVGDGEALGFARMMTRVTRPRTGVMIRSQARTYQFSIHSLVTEARVLSNCVERSVQRISKCSLTNGLI